MKPEIQEVVKVDLIDSVSEVEQNVSLQTQPREGYLARRTPDWKYHASTF